MAQLGVGDSYHIVEDGVRLRGTIKRETDNGGYLVEWSDGTTTIEEDLDPENTIHLN